MSIEPGIRKNDYQNSWYKENDVKKYISVGIEEDGNMESR